MIKMQDVKKTYGEFELSCSLTVREGYVTGLIGQNGAGKSTTFKTILGLTGIDGGEIEVLGKAPTELTAADREALGVVMSNSGFSNYLRVKDMVPILRKMYTQFDETAFDMYCRQFKIPVDKKIKEFSTGMKAKLNVICAITHGARLLILDEPTAGLDVIARDKLLDLLRSYMEPGNRSILISSHISGDLESLCDDLYLIEEGKILMHEDTDVLVGSYGLLKMSGEQYQTLDKRHVICSRQERYGYSCLTDKKQYYMDHYPEMTIEKGTIDEVITMMNREVS